jgi:hypothetical protein
MCLAVGINQQHTRIGHSRSSQHTGDAQSDIGTVVEGLIANYYIQALNNTGRTHLASFSDNEILATAGLSPESPTPLPTNRPPTPRNDAFSLKAGHRLISRLRNY